MIALLAILTVLFAASFIGWCCLFVSSNRDLPEDAPLLEGDGQEVDHG